MVTRRKIKEFWTETHRAVGDEVKVVTCCCASPGASAKECALAAGNKTRCRCFCHSKRLPKNPE